eukprot:TRINITY_DN44168_c0_g1_i1.p1 TRINITY_DN44168_c0_g1~~TRINITY_DN44168_c0_g1_i1.p1  ORF type:complete len:270 (+),score=31.61 TRINITY_DN44168_c0_g1_i1:143-952(+)
MAEEKYKLFVGSLPPDTTQDELRIVFGTYGNPTDIHIMQGKSNSGQSCAFIVFDKRESAETAIASLDGVYSLREANDPPIRVAWAKGSGGPPVVQAPIYQAPTFLQPVVRGGPVLGGIRPQNIVAFRPPSLPSWTGSQPQPFPAQKPLREPLRDLGGGIGASGPSFPPPPPPDPSIMLQKRAKLFVGNLPSDITSETISMVFGHYGTVTNVHVMVGKAKSGQSCAFVEYSGPIEAETAILTLHEKYEIRAGEGPIVVKYANSQIRPAPY